MRCLKRYVARKVFYYLVPLKAVDIPRSIDIPRGNDAVKYDVKLRSIILCPKSPASLSETSTPPRWVVWRLPRRLRGAVSLASWGRSQGTHRMDRTNAS